MKINSIYFHRKQRYMSVNLGKMTWDKKKKKHYYVNQQNDNNNYVWKITCSRG